MTKPEPSELTLRCGCSPSRCCFSKKSSKNSLNGEFSGRLGSGTWPLFPSTFWVVDILMTAGRSLAAALATDSGPAACAVAVTARKTDKAASRIRARGLKATAPVLAQILFIEMNSMLAEPFPSNLMGYRLEANISLKPFFCRRDPFCRAGSLSCGFGGRRRWHRRFSRRPGRRCWSLRRGRGCGQRRG